MKTCMIVQARMSSERLPGKVLKPVLGKALLEYELERLKRVANVDEIIVATTALASDDPVTELCRRLGFEFHRGSEKNVLERFYEAALKHQAGVIVRICADCPVIDPKIVEDTVAYFLNNQDRYDYVSNFFERRFPRGMDCEIFSFASLEEAQRNSDSPHEREHVTPYIENRPERFRLGGYTCERDLSHIRLTVDTVDDFRLIEKILGALYPIKPTFSMTDILGLLERNPEWLRLNAHVRQKT